MYPISTFIFPNILRLDKREIRLPLGTVIIQEREEAGYSIEFPAIGLFMRLAVPIAVEIELLTLSVPDELERTDVIFFREGVAHEVPDAGLDTLHDGVVEREACGLGCPFCTLTFSSTLVDF